MGMMGVGIVAADTVTVTANFTSTYMPATCVLSATGAGGSVETPVLSLAIDPVNGGILYVQNAGKPDTLGTTFSDMPVSVAYNDEGGVAESAPSAGWYQGATWIDGITTYVTAGGAYGTVASPTALPGNSNPSLSVESSLPSDGSNTWYPITFTVTAPPKLTAGLYDQQIVVTGSC